MFSSFRAFLSSPVAHLNQDTLNPSTIYDSDVCDESTLKRVLHCLRELANNSQPKEEMMFVSRLQFHKYLVEPSSADAAPVTTAAIIAAPVINAAISAAPAAIIAASVITAAFIAAAVVLLHPRTLLKYFHQQHYHKGDFDVLIIHRQHGLFTLKIKSVGDNFSQVNMTEQQEDDLVMKKVNEAVKQLNKAEVVLKDLTSDIRDLSQITKILVMPNITSGQLLRALITNISDAEALCHSLGVHSVDVMKLCLLSDQLSDKRTPSDVNHIVLTDLGVWWQRVVRASRPQPLITQTVYEQLVARFCGPATTMEVHCVTDPRLDIKILGEAVSETRDRTARLVLFPQQVQLLNRSPPRVFVTGPPGTGKTIGLIIQALTWIQSGHDVHVVSTWYESHAATIIIEHQLQETMRTTTASSRVHRHQYNFMKDGEVETAVRCLKSLSRGRQLCVIADEVVNYYYRITKFCDQLIKQVPGVYLWGASMYYEVRPLCLEEVKLTTPLRSPPVVLREVLEAKQIKEYKVVYDYTVSDVSVPTDGPAVIQFTHHDGQSGHTEDMPRDCVECGRQVARVLTELNVGRTGMSVWCVWYGNSNGPPPLQFNDVLVLCEDYPSDDRVNKNGQVTTTASGLVRGLRACHVPVRVVGFGDEAAIRDTALGVSDLVTVTNWRCVRGLERKVVVVENNKRVDLLQRLHAMSRCTSQLVFIDWRHN